jgi:hypothetical protein
VISEPLILLAVAAAPAVLAWHRPRWLLLLLFAALSFVLQAAADIQAGGNINYFFESLFAIVPFAVLGTFKVISWCRERPALGALLVALVLIHLLLPLTIEFYRNRKAIGPHAIAASNAEFRRQADFLRGRHILSLIPRLAILDPHPALTEPYLYSYMERLGKLDAAPIVARIVDREFDVVIGRDDDPNWRGVSLMPGTLLASIDAFYQRQCSISPAVFYVPRNRAIDSGLIAGLKAMGCVSK